MEGFFQPDLFASVFAVLFVLIEQGTSRAHQRDMAVKSVLVAALILVGFVFGGEWVFTKLGISLDALRIAGGIMLFIIGLNMVFEKRQERRESRADEVLHEVSDPEDISVFPMGIPMVAGPGTMASLLLLTGETESWGGMVTILSALFAVLTITFISFLAAPKLMNLIGENATGVITRVFGVLLATLAAQFIIDGISGSLLN